MIGCLPCKIIGFKSPPIFIIKINILYDVRRLNNVNHLNNCISARRLVIPLTVVVSKQVADDDMRGILLIVSHLFNSYFEYKSPKTIHINVDNK